MLSRTIKSMLSQEYENFEYIIIDDGSTDNTEEVVRSIDDPRIKYFKKKNEERNIARNYGIQKSSGDYIGFLDSDDTLYPNHLSEAKSLIIVNNSPELVHLNFVIQGNTEKPSLISSHDITDLNRFLIRDNILTCNSIFIRRDITQEFKFLDSQEVLVGEDHYLWLKLASRYKIFSTKKVTSVVHEHGERSLNNIDVDKLINATLIIRNKLKIDTEFKNYYGWRVSPFYASKFIHLALELTINQRKIEAFTYLLTALKIYPLALFSRQTVGVIKNLIKN